MLLLYVVMVLKNVKFKHMLRVTTTGWRRCETLESMSALLCHQKGTFSGNRSLLCAVDGILCDSACGEYASRFAGEVVLAARQPVASLRLLRRKPLLYFHPSFFSVDGLTAPSYPEICISSQSSQAKGSCQLSDQWHGSPVWGLNIGSSQGEFLLLP